MEGDDDEGSGGEWDVVDFMKLRSFALRACWGVRVRGSRCPNAGRCPGPGPVRPLRLRSDVPAEGTGDRPSPSPSHRLGGRALTLSSALHVNPGGGTGQD